MPPSGTFESFAFRLGSIVSHGMSSQRFALQARHRWPLECEDLHGLSMPYLAHLSKLVLDEDSAPYAFVLPIVYGLYLGVSESTWEKQLSERYLTLKDVWLGWLYEAAARIQSRLRDGEEHEV